MNFEEKIKELKLDLPEAKAPVGSYVASKIIGNMLFISGQISISSNGELIKGKLGKDLKTDNLKVSSFCQILKKNQWVNMPSKPKENTKLENVILNEAKKLKLTSG